MVDISNLERNSLRRRPGFYSQSCEDHKSITQRYHSEPSHTRQTMNEYGAVSFAFTSISTVSVETMAITALPMDVWLKERLKKWVQLSGHEGSIVPATTSTLYKKQAGNCSEARAYELIAKDSALTGFTPRYYKQLHKNDECFIEIEDLLQQFADPAKTSIMDIKIGTRTFLESEVSNTKRRKDLYEKMTAIDPDEPTPEERACGEITKLRYMQFRERESSSASMGFRIEAAKVSGGCLQKNFKKVRTVDDVARTLINFFGEDQERVRSKLLARLKAMRSAIEKSRFFATHEVVGSSLLIVHDSEKVNCWMIDFAKSSPVDPPKSLNHRTPWVPGNSEDGYLTGIDNLIKILEDMPSMDVISPTEEFR
ncbi:Inositol-trisphosphate 3-kinase [Parelaphostrongylus tenuis]|uniref:Kinase n=1 Tax=Parelaphostrongylus tenuis TaxID=148309 RepID=A0AAD5R5G9_PARTN|nr:Inositol-trisphosphate 3-kinase [Parelaphostrongylus tenuis]